MFERLLAFSIQHRHLVLLLVLGVAIIGAFSLKRLPIDAVPDITNKQIQINTLAQSLGPLEMEKQVTYPVETALAGIPNLEYTRSLTRNGFSQVTAIFTEETDIFWARQQVAERIQSVTGELPAEAAPQLGPISTGLGEVYTFILELENSESDFTTPDGEVLKTSLQKSSYLRTLMEWVVVPQLVRVKGIASVDVIGGYEKQFHVQPDPQKLIAYNISFHDVIESLEANNVSTGAGFVQHKGNAYVVKTDNRVRSIDEIGAIMVGQHQGTPIFVRDVADVVLGEEMRTGAGSENGHEVVIGTTMMLPGENSRTVAAAVDSKMKDIRLGLPAGVTARTVLNRQQLVDSTIHTVVKNLAEGAMLVIVVLFVMLGNFRAALITALAIPLSMLLASIGMVKAGISGNLMSLGALDFGIIVDGAVIIGENCLRALAERQHHEGRMLALRERLHVVFHATKQMVQPSVFGQAIIVIVYIPILTLSGVEGKMFDPMALTVIFALAGAFILSLTFVPAAVAIFIKGRVTEKENIIVRGAKYVYTPVLAWSLRVPVLIVVSAVALLGLGVVVFRTLGQEFIPTLNEGNLALQSLRVPSTSLQQSLAMQFEVERAVSKLPEVELMFSKTGTTEVAFDPMPPSISDGFVILKPRDQWPDPSLTKGELFEKLEAVTAHLPGQLYESSQPIQLRFNELLAGTRGDLAIKVYGDDFAAMTSVANSIAETVGKVPGAADVKVEQTEGLPVMNIEVDRELAARYGMSVRDVQDVIAIAIGGREAGLVFEGDRRFPMIVRLPEEIRRDFTALENLPIPIPVDEDDQAPVHLASLHADRFSSQAPLFVPLGSLARIKIEEGPNQISRENGKRRVTVTANVRDRDLGGFVSEVQDAITQNVKLQPGTWIEFGGSFKNLVAARGRLLVVVPICFFVIFLLLYSAFNSARYAVLVFSGVPLGLTGGVIALWLRDIDLSISAAVGFIALSGVAVLNGLVMVSYINQLRAEGRSIDDAIREGATTRLRPVLMTALVASLGFVPMALSTGNGAEVQRPLATVVIGGLVSSTILTLVVLPALYRLWIREVKEDDAATG
ncbi:CusA/CzcA family heavy metal efflux RND transporter [Candidatus Sumerlaeota bacterium]|nr:CusA/CzcA family heavy metal efflux RND transporter [Candidatus Sumerlaeota bacterium]